MPGVAGQSSRSGARLKSTKDLQLGFGQSQQAHEQERIHCVHPQFIDRHHRLDLISHELCDLSAQVGSRSYSLCDISRGGFSYAQHVPHKAGVSIHGEWERVNSHGRELHNKIVEVVFSFRDQPQTKFKVHGRVCNHRLFFGLKIDAVEKEIKELLFRKRISKKDPLKRFYKGNAIIQSALQLSYNGNWNMPNLIALNMTLLNFFEEMSATEADFEYLRQGYDHRPLFIKFGLAVDDPKEAAQLLHFAQNRGLLPEEELLQEFVHPEPAAAAVSLERLHQRQRQHPQAAGDMPVAKAAQRASKVPFLEKLNAETNAGVLLDRAWDLGLKHWGLDAELVMPLPEEEPFASQLRLELSDKPLQVIFDSLFQDQASLAHQYLFQCFRSFLDAPHHPDDDTLHQEIGKLMQLSLDQTLRELGWRG